MTVTANTTRKTIAQLLAEHASEIVPSNGDRAYTRYHNREYVGVLRELTRPEERIFGTMGGTDNRSIGKLIPEDPKENWGWHSDFPGLTVGYDEEIKWDAERGMFYAPADYD